MRMGNSQPAFPNSDDGIAESLKGKESTEVTEVPRLKKMIEEHKSKTQMLEDKIKRRDKIINKNEKYIANKQDEIKKKR